MKRKPKPHPDLFGAPRAAPRDRTPVELTLEEIPKSSTALAFFLRQPWKGGKSGFAPRSECAPIEGRAGWWRMAKWLARERGWL